MRRTLAAMATLLALSIGLSGCGNGNNDSSSEAPVDASGGAAREAKPPAPNEQGGKVPQATAGTDKGSNQPSIARAIVRTGSLTVQVKDVDGDDVMTARQQMIGIVSGLRGLISNEATGNDKDGAISRAELTLRIPTANYDKAIERLSDELGTVKMLKQDSQDVTEQVVDVNSRIANQRAGLARMRALLARAKTVSEIITVESELTRREADLESLLARQKALADQTELATLTVVLLQPGKPAPPPAPPADRGFVYGLEKGWNAFSSTVTALAVTVGALLPFLVTLALLGVPAWFLYRRQRRAPAPVVSGEVEGTG